MLRYRRMFKKNFKPLNCFRFDCLFVQSYYSGVSSLSLRCFLSQWKFVKIIWNSEWREYAMTHHWFQQPLARESFAMRNFFQTFSFQSFWLKYAQKGFIFHVCVWHCMKTYLNKGLSNLFQICIHYFVMRAFECKWIRFKWKTTSFNFVAFSASAFVPAIPFVRVQCRLELNVSHGSYIIYIGHRALYRHADRLSSSFVRFIGDGEKFQKVHSQQYSIQLT